MKKLQILIIVPLIVTSVNFVQCAKKNNQDTGTNVAIINLDTLSFSHIRDKDRNKLPFTNNIYTTSCIHAKRGALRHHS